jgi:hypothetical protein
VLEFEKIKMQKNTKPKNKITPQMFDVRPVDEQGNLDVKKINQIERVSKLELFQKAKQKEKKFIAFYDVRPATPQEDEIKRFKKFIQAEREGALFGKKTANVDIFQDTNIVQKIDITNAEAALKKKAKEKEKLRQQLERQKAEEKKISLRARKTALKKRQSESKRQEAKLARGLFYHKLKRWPLFFIKSLLAILIFPFKVLSHFLKAISAFFNSIYRSIDNFFELFATKGRSHYRYRKNQLSKRAAFSFLTATTIIFLFFFGTGFFYHGLKVRDLAMENGKIAYANLNDAKEGIIKRDFDGAIFKFNEAYDRFDMIQKDINSLGSVIVESSRFVPYFSKLSSGEQLSEAGKNISRIGVLATDIIKTLNNIKNPTEGAEPVSYLKIFQDSDKNLTEIALRINDLQGNLEKINLADIPSEQRDNFVALKKKIPEINKFVSSFSEEGKILTDVLGGNGPRKYLFLFQNNQEMRATGGFIGTYAVLDISDGNVRNFFVDGIFNPDGQLREKIIPPEPIQKISAAWSLHDSNWFPDFPMSAEKASWFYEKTGGPTVDGVITMTPTVMQKLLEITGPIEMSEYAVTIDKDNFLEKIQYEVEVDYDKELNQPKKILADLTPLILDRVFNVQNISDITKTLDVLLASLNEKHILIYSKNYNIEKMLSENGWSGEILDTEKDYLSVINTNINGYKTDGVIEEKIEHKADVQSDGSIIDTVTITRKHTGGDTDFDWWNKVNADYMRVYVPRGAKLIHASGQTNEFNSPPIDYSALGFKKDPQVGMEEESMIIDSESGTRIYEDSGKTVFANWIYVSPKESVTISYSYILPFKLQADSMNNPADTYSLLAQKQSGSVGSQFSSKIVYPSTYQTIWKYPSEEISDFSTDEDQKNGIGLESKLNTDKFVGIAFKKAN